MRNVVALLLGIWIVSFLNSCSSSYSDAPEKPNVLILTVDDMNYDYCCGFETGNNREVTPNINRLTEQGTLFSRAHVSIPVCVPCRTSIMTARYPHRSAGHSGFDKVKYNIDDDVTTLTEVMKEAGYLTAMLAKVNHHQPYEKFPLDIAYGHHDYDELRYGRDPEYFARRVQEVVDASQEQGKPFFLVANASDPHRPFPGSEQEKKYYSKPGYSGDGPIPDPSKTYTPEEIQVPGFLPDIPEVRKEVAEFVSGTRRADDAVGKTLEVLEKNGLSENTIVFFLSDHGMPFPFAKENLYINGTKTPLIVRWPGKVEAGVKDDDHFVSVLDIAPTILEMLGLPPMPDVDGRTLQPLLQGETQDDREHIVTVYHHTPGHDPIPMRAINRGAFGYIFNAWSAEGLPFTCGDPKGGLTYPAMKQAAETDADIAARVQFFEERVPEELYNYEEDPNALNNLISDDTYQEDIHQMRNELLAWMRDKEDPLLPYYESYLSKTAIKRK